MYSCKKTIQETTADEAINLSTRAGSGNENENSTIIELGINKINPYTVSNMVASYSALNTSGVNSLRTVNIRATHLYIKFKPQNYYQYLKIKEDSTIATSDIPIEANIVKQGNVYHDPALPNDVPTYQYTAVKVGYRFIDTIPYEIISQLYIPEQDEALNGSNFENKIYVDKLLDQAYIQTNNFTDTIKAPVVNSDNNRFTPGGRIRIFDTRTNTRIGMEGVLIKANRWFTNYFAQTNFNGDYRMANRFDRPCNYSLHFVTGRYLVMEHFFGLESKINGPKLEGDWNFDINNGYDRFIGHIFRGAFRYNYKFTGGLKRPTDNLVSNTQVVHLYRAKNGFKGSSGSATSFPVITFIRISRFKNAAETVEYLSDEVFSTTCHETAHSSHVNSMNGLPQYWQVQPKIQESWALAVEWQITSIEYVERGIANYGQWNYHPNPVNDFFLEAPNDQGYQYWNQNNWDYTSLFINLIDDFNENNLIFDGFLIPSIVNDGVTGYSLQFIEQNLLKHVYGVSTLETLLRANKPVGVTDLQLSELLKSYY